MKNKYSLIITLLLLFAVEAFAQNQAMPALKLRNTLSVPSKPFSVLPRNADSQMILDYDSADSQYWNEPNINNVIYNMNKHYSITAGDSFTYQNCIVRFDSLYDPYTQQTIDRNTVTNIVVDSIYALIGHSNKSFTNDTLVARIVNLNASRYPGTTTLWTDTTIMDYSLSPNDNWLIAQYLVWKPNYSQAMKGFAFELDYYGDRSDTCGFTASFHDQGPCGSPTPFLTQSAARSKFYPNSYFYYTRFSDQYPTSTGGFIYYDCNNNGQYNDGIDANSFIQNINIIAFITVSTNVGIQEDLKNTGMGLYQNVPNPLHNSTDIKYELANNAKDVTLTVFDIVGNKVMQIKEGNKTKGKYVFTLDATKLARGMYTYTLSADGSQLTKKMIIE